jgi:hypothetical protein
MTQVATDQTAREQSWIRRTVSMLRSAWAAPAAPPLSPPPQTPSSVARPPAAPRPSLSYQGVGRRRQSGRRHDVWPRRVW